MNKSIFRWYIVIHPTAVKTLLNQIHLFLYIDLHLFTIITLIISCFFFIPSNIILQSGNSVLATYRCQLNTVRLEMKFQVDEGIKGTLQTYITPQSKPKSCHRKTFKIKPLSLHCRVHELDENRYLLFNFYTQDN